MKKLFKSALIIFFVLIMSAHVFASGEGIRVDKVVDAETIALSGTYTSAAIPLEVGTLGYFSIQVEITGDGTAKFEYLISNNETDYLEPSAASDIATGIVKTSGPGSDGKDIYSFPPIMGKSIKIKVTETGGANGIVVSVWLAHQ